MMVRTTAFNTRAVIASILCFWAVPTLGVTNFAPDSCNILGDVDVYGRGIRIGLYLQWAAVLLSYIISPLSSTGVRAASNTLYFAVLVNTLYGALHNPEDIVVLEWYIARLLTFWLLIYNWPVSMFSALSQLGSIVMAMFLGQVSSFIDLWIYFRRVEQGMKPGCSVKLFLFVPFESSTRAWVVWSRVSGIMFCVSEPVLLGLTIYLTGYILRIDLFQYIDSADFDATKERKVRRSIRIAYFILLAAFGAATITFLEKTLIINDIKFENDSLLNSGQLIPMMVGVGSMVSVIWQGIGRVISDKYPLEVKKEKIMP